MSQKFKSDIETQAGLIDSFGFTGTAGQVLSSTGTKTEWITPPQTPGGGGSSQVFYFNGGTVSSVGGYYQMSPVANTGTAADFSINANGYIASFLTDVASPNQLNIPAGNWNFEIYFSASSSGGSPSFYVELYKYSSGGVFTLIASSSAAPEGITNGTAIDAYFTPLAVPATTLLVTDRLAVRVYVTHSGRTITMHTQNGHLSEVITTFSTGLTALNGLTAQVQYFAPGTVGTDFNISSATNTHTFNLPTASAVNRGALSSADWTTFNSKANASGTVNYVSKFTGATTLGNSQIFDNGNEVGIGTIVPEAKLSVVGTKGVISQYNTTDTLTANCAIELGAYLTTYPDSGTHIRAYVNHGSTTASDLAFEVNGQQEKMRIASSGNVGIATTTPAYKLDVNGTGRFSSDLLTTGRFGVGSTNINSRVFASAFSGELSAAIFTTFDNSAGTQEAARFSTADLVTGAVKIYPRVGVASYNGITIADSAVIINQSTKPLLVGTQDGSAIQFTTTDIRIGTNNSEKMRITSAGNVGIGTATPGVKFVNSGGTASSGPTLGSGVVGSQALLSNNGLFGMYSGVSDTTGDVWHQVQRNDANASVYNLALQPSGGSILIGTNAPVYSPTSKVQVLFNGLAEYGITFKTTFSVGIALNFVNSAGVQVGRVIHDDTGTAYVTTSDYRLKEDLKEIKGLDLISQINVYDYKWKSNDKRSFGVMAHELQEIIPQAVFGQKDDEENMQGVDYSLLVPILVQAIQELKVEIELLKQTYDKI